jgi:hypothetical protein
LILVEFRKERGLRVDERLAGLGGYRFVGFQAAIAANVKHGVAVFAKYAADEQAAMTVGRIFLATNQGDAESLHAGFKASNGCPEMRIFVQPAIKDVAFGVVVGGIGGASAQFGAEKEIADSRFFQGTLHEFPVELRDIFRVGRATRIDHHFNAMLAEQGKPGLNGVVGVADSIDTAHARTLAKEDSTLTVNGDRASKVRSTCAIQTAVAKPTKPK